MLKHKTPTELETRVDEFTALANMYVEEILATCDDEAYDSPLKLIQDFLVWAVLRLLSSKRDV